MDSIIWISIVFLFLNIVVLANFSPSKVDYNNFCKNVSANGFDIFINKSLTEDSYIIYERKSRFEAFLDCLDGCFYDNHCLIVDYNCETGICIFYTGNYDFTYQLVSSNGHISALCEAKSAN